MSNSFHNEKYMFVSDHQNWFGIDSNLGPVAISIRREKVPPPGFRNQFSQHLDFRTGTPAGLLPGGGGGDMPEPAETAVYQPLCSRDVYMYRLIVRTLDLLPLRGCVLEESIPALKSSEKIKSLPTKEVLEFVMPEIQLPR